MALQVHAAQPAEVAEAWPVETDDVAEEVGLANEALDAVVGRGGVRRGSLVPAGAVHRAVVGHRGIVARLGPPCFAARPALLEAAVA